MKQVKVVALYREKVYEPRGTPIRVLNLLSRLDKEQGIDLSFFSWDKSAPDFTKHVYLDNNHKKDFKTLYRFIKDNNVQVVFGFLTSTLYYLVPLKLFTGVKIMIEVQGFVEDQAKAYGSISFIKYWLMKLFFRFAYLYCDGITTSEGPTIVEQLGKYNKNIIPMYGGVDLDAFNPNASSGNHFRKDERIVIGYAGNARIWQGIDFLIDAYKELRKRTKDFRLVLLLSEKKESYSNEVEVFGPLPNREVPSFLTECDILVIPRPDMLEMRYAVSGKLTEYLAMGKPVLASTVGDADRVITSGVNGMLYSPGDQQEFIDRLYELRNVEFRQRLGAEGRKLAEQYSWEILTQILCESIYSVIKK